MTRSAAILVFLSLMAGGALAASPEATYLAARDKAIAEIKALQDAKTSESAIQAAEDKATADLVKQLKDIIGPVAIEGFASPDHLNIALREVLRFAQFLQAVADHHHVSFNLNVAASPESSAKGRVIGSWDIKP